ncbi:MAG: glycosyltransferase family 4 protein [Dehalococcoidales bacterium]|nr:glycosyltransferase family 4 protein [Dehalococcoidales bacterium]
MRIAQIAPLYESVPPALYGGTERVVSYLTDELVRRGHDVTLFASGDSTTFAKLVYVCQRALRLDPTVVDMYVHLMAQIGLAYDHAGEFDLIHSHVDYFTFPLTRYVNTPTVTTLHGRLDLPELQTMYRLYPEVNLISISDSQRRPLPDSHWVATVYNGIPVEDFALCEKSGDYLAFLGRISPEKRVDLAIDVARRAGMKLKIAAKVDKVDVEYFKEVIKPLLEDPRIEYIGEISQQEKSDFLGHAYALIFPIEWPEPFGLAMTEAMACGTPVIARPYGSVFEIVVPGETGFICNTKQEMVEAIEKVEGIDRAACRRRVEKYFSVQAMGDGYEAAYRKISAEQFSTTPFAIDGGSFSEGTQLVRVRPARRP